jgi:hypothetical protein
MVDVWQKQDRRPHSSCSYHEAHLDMPQPYRSLDASSSGLSDLEQSRPVVAVGGKSGCNSTGYCDNTESCGSNRSELTVIYFATDNNHSADLKIRPRTPSSIRSPMGVLPCHCVAFTSLQTPRGPTILWHSTFEHLGEMRHGTQLHTMAKKAIRTTCNKHALQKLSTHVASSNRSRFPNLFCS